MYIYTVSGLQVNIAQGFVDINL